MLFSCQIDDFLGIGAGIYDVQFVANRNQHAVYFKHADGMYNKISHNNSVAASAENPEEQNEKIDKIEIKGKSPENRIFFGVFGITP